MAKRNFPTNEEIAALLRRIAAVYEIKGNQFFKVNAYRRAADGIEHATSEAKDFYDEGKLDELPGVGKNIARHLKELFETGKVKHFDRLLKKLPPAVFIFLDLPGIGPKTAYKLATKLNIKKAENALQRLKRAAQNQQIRKIAGFKEQTEKKILAALKSQKKKKNQEKRMLLSYAHQLAQTMIAYLKKCPHVIRVDPLGSLRRRVATIGDIDLAVASRKPEKVIEHFVSYPKVKKVLSKGKASLGRIILDNNQQIDLRVQSPDQYGAMLQYFTGSKHHNIALREMALKKGLSLSEYGIKIIKTGQLKKFTREEDFYRFLKMDWIPPEIREGGEEIEAALKHRLPQLVTKKEIKGDLHLHSNFNIEPSHDLGHDSFQAMAKKAIGLGYQYIAFTEHNPSISQHSEKEIISLIKRKKETIDKLNYSLKNQFKKRTNNLLFHIFNALEVDIRPNGELALPEKAFSYLDWVIVSVHTQFNLPKKEMTNRIIKGLSHPKAKILGHPTGRLLNEREGYEIDWEKLFTFCLKNGKILEINSFPQRLDLPDSLVFEAVKRGVKLVINSDAHALKEMDFLTYGVDVARRGWAKSSDIINTRKLTDLKKILN